MKLNRLSWLLVTIAAAALTTFSCSKSENPSPKPGPQPTPETSVDICITGDFNDFGTKAEIENIFRMTWSATDTATVRDTVYVYGQNSSTIKYLGKLAAYPVEGTGNRVADLKGTITAPDGDTKLTLVYSPVLTEAPEVSGDAISIDLKNQSGAAGSVVFVAYTAVDYKGSETATYRTSFSFATSVLRVNVSDLTPNTALTQAELGEIETACKLTFKSDAIPTVTGEAADTITRALSGCSANAKGCAAFYVAVPIITANADRKLTVVQGSDVTEYAGFATGAKDAGKMMNSIASMQYIPFDLSSGATANCYIVSQPGTYKFKTVQGNSSTSIGTVNSVSVLWESYGTSTSPTVGDLIRTDLSFTDNYITFTTGSQFPMKKGNAVITAKDGSGNILWSWHIWCTDQPAEQAYNGNAGTMMDRNLGATSATKGDVGALGLLYQWGRKDPFLSGESITSSTVAKSTGTWPSPTSSTASTGTLAYAVQHPMQRITKNTSNQDWYYTGSSSTDNTRWQTSDKTKGLYDPCPAGWRVPDGGDSGVWNTAEFSTETSGTFSNGFDFSVLNPVGTTWYPAAGHSGSSDGILTSVGEGGRYWSCTPNNSQAYALYFVYVDDNYVNPSFWTHRACAQSVRCISESK